jgi:hypothetical protein
MSNEAADRRVGDQVQTDPDPANPRAIRCYDKAGLERMGVVNTPDGPALLMVCTRARFEALTRAQPVASTSCPRRRR